MARTKQFNREDVLEKAKQLFWKQGFHATSVQNLVDHLGINRASIYDTFGGKNQLYEAALHAYQKENIGTIKKSLTRFSSVKKSLRALYRNIIVSSINDPECKGCFTVNCTTEYLPLHKHILSDLADNKETFIQVIIEALEAAKQKGELSTDHKVKETASFLFMLLNGLQIMARTNSKKSEIFTSIDIGLRVLD